MKWIKKNVDWLLSVILMLMTITVFGPIELYLTNSSEFWFGFDEMLKISGIMAVVLGTVLLFAGLVLRGKARSFFSAVLFTVALCMYIQGNFLNMDYGLLDGSAIDWSAYTKYAVINTVCWGVCISILLLLWKNKAELFERITRLVSLVIIAIQILTLGMLAVNSDVLSVDESSRVSTDQIMEIGSENNIIIFVLDTFDDPLMDSIMESDGEYYRTLFADFTRFTDCAAGGATTAAAMPILISGEYYTDGLRYSEYVNNAFNSDQLYDALRDEGYSITMYTDSAYLGTSANGYVENYIEGAGQPSSYAGLTAKYSTFTLFKYMPHILKQFFWLYTAEFNAYQPSESYVMDEAAFYNMLVSERLQVTGKSSFRLIHLQGAHYPYTINEYARLDETATRVQQAKGNLFIVEEYINQMKACGVYDNSMIIITADHGDSANYSAPILFVKDRGTTGAYEENDAPVSHIDLHPTLFSYLGKDTGNSFFEISAEQQRERLFYLRLQEAGSFYMQEYLISDKVSVVGNGTTTGSKLAPTTETTSVILGKKMSLGLDGDGNQYIVSGLDIWPMDCAETVGLESVFSFNLDESLTKDLDVAIDVLRIYDENIEQSIQIFANGQLCHEEKVLGEQVIKFTIPADVLDGKTLELKLVYATQWCQLYLSGITIGTGGEENNGFSITDIVAIPLTALMRLCYNLLNNYGLTIVVFTLLSKIILLPVSMWVHKNGITMVRITPEINRIKIKYYGDKDSIDDETQALYKQEKYNPLASTVPMIVQIVMLLGVIGAVKNLLADADSVLTLVPSKAGGLTYLMPVAAGAAALALGLAQNHLSPLQREQSKKEQWMANGFSIGISLFLGAFVSLGVGIYWVCSNLLSILQQMLLNVLIRPEKYIDYEELERSKKELTALDNLSAGASKEDRKRERDDYKRFFSIANKHLVIYSEKSGFYKYYKDVMDFMLKYSNVIIHYVTNDPKDQIFKIAENQPRIKPYYISEKKLITLLMKMDADIVVMTCPDLDRYHLKRSYVRKDIEYVYMFHYPLSTHMVLNNGALDHYDTILCVGDFQFEEIRAAERVYNLPEKKLISAGYGQLEQLYNSYCKMEPVKRANPKILIAPSWQQDNILDSCLDPLLEQLLDKGYEVVVRPHPEYVKRYKPRMDSIVQKYANRETKDLTFELDFTSNDSLFNSDIIISDWSGSAYEFSLVTLKPAVFINTPPKINNPEYEKLNVEPLEFKLRSEVGIQVDPNDLIGLDKKIDALLENSEAYADQIKQIRDKYIANFGKSGEIGGKYILSQLLERQKKK